jgi:hypothetical protein
MPRQHAAERGFAGAAQPDQGDAPPALGALGRQKAGFDQLRELGEALIGQLRHDIEQRRARATVHSRLAQQIRGGNVERLRDGAQHRDRRIASAAFDLRQISFRGVRG